MKKTFLISILLVVYISAQAQFEQLLNNSNSYSFPVDLKKLPNGQQIRISEYNKLFLNYTFGEQYHYNIKGEYDDDRVATFIHEKSAGNYDNKLYLLGKLNLSSEYTTLIFKLIEYNNEYILLNNYTKSGKLLSAICLFYTEREYDVISSTLTVNNEIIQEETSETIDMEIMQKTFVLDKDGHFRVKKQTIITDEFSIDETEVVLQQEIQTLPKVQSTQPDTKSNIQTTQQNLNGQQKITFTEGDTLISSSGAEEQFQTTEGDTFEGEMKDGKVVYGKVIRNGETVKIFLNKRNH